jgi:hypothetical protein
MKRSEVLKLIQGLFEVSADFDSATRAENLLANLEEVGMRAPAVKKVTFRDIDGWLYSDSYYDWEPES